MLADPAILGDAKTGLPDARIEAEVAHQLLRFAEPVDIPDRRNDPGGHDGIDAGDRLKPTDPGIVNRIPGDITIKVYQILSQAIDLTDTSGDRGPFVVRKPPPLKPGAAAIVEQIGMRALRHEMRLL
ncbi:hypothetical protein X747_31995 [Mesorhizobium sp. LNJC384A00]|nr:hypothetical protein X747_31995 [Mesorhizobium sp. LNJC384A00]